MDDLFAPLESPWQRVSPKLATARRLIGLPIIAVIGTGAVVVLWVIDVNAGYTWLLPAGLLLVTLIGMWWFWFWAGRNARSWGYAENADDLLVTGGVMFRRLVAIPYGRMQYVDVKAGPIQRWFGIASVTLHTASTETAAEIPGVLSDDARVLRNRLTEIGEAHGAGI